MPDVPQWHLEGDWFDVCKCTIPCPCTFAQAPSEGDCEGILAWHIRDGQFGDVRLDDLNVVALGAFEGNLWAGEAKATMGIYIDERADAARPEGAGAQPTRRGGGARAGRDLGRGDDRPRRRLRLEVGMGRPLEQALPVQLERAGRIVSLLGA